MKKLIRASLFLLSVGLFMLASQISCKKSTAGPSTTNTASIKVLYAVVNPAGYTVSNGDTTRTPASNQIYYCNEDGSSPTLVNMPANISWENPHLTSDGTTVIFEGTSNGVQSIYSMDLDGSNLKAIVNGPVQQGASISVMDVN
jgi:Tol biopolymer transport system component